MASRERETSLPGELFQDHVAFSEDNNNNNNHHHSIMVSLSPKGLRTYESISVSCGSSYSSWSDLSSPFGSELESTSETTESEDEEFISELTRQMAESMLQDDDDGEEIQDRDNNNNNNNYTVFNCLPENSVSEGSELSLNASDCKSGSVCYYYNSPGFMSESESPTPESAANVRNLSAAGVYSDDNSTDEQLRPVQVYELKNQPQLKKQVPGGCGYGGKRVKPTDSTQQLNRQKEQQNMQNRGKAWKHGQGQKASIPLAPTPQAGSGMRAVFLGRSERSGSAGTGVFLPGGAFTKPEPKRKSGCSTVLIPARVLQTLQQHFNTAGVVSPSNSSGGSANQPWQNDVLERINGLLSQKKEHAELQTRPPPNRSAAEANLPPEVQLPQEWTY